MKTLVEDAITERTRAIIPVHLFAQPLAMTTIREIDLRRIQAGKRSL